REGDEGADDCHRESRLHFAASRGSGDTWYGAGSVACGGADRSGDLMLVAAKALRGSGMVAARPGKAGRRTAAASRRTPHQAPVARVSGALGPGVVPLTTKPRALSVRARCISDRREIPRLRVPALRAKAKTRDTPLGMTFGYAGAGC